MQIRDIAHFKIWAVVLLLSESRAIINDLHVDVILHGLSSTFIFPVGMPIKEDN